MTESDHQFGDGVEPFPVQVQTGNLNLRPYQKPDAAALLEMVSSERIRLGEVFAEPVLRLQTLADAERLIDSLEASWRDSQHFIISVWLTRNNALVGEVYLGSIDRGTREADIGIFVRRDFEGLGLAREAIEACILAAARDMGLLVLHYRCDANNTRSCRLAERTSFIDTGERGTHGMRKDGTNASTLHYRRELEWPGQREHPRSR